MSSGPSNIIAFFVVLEKKKKLTKSFTKKNKQLQNGWQKSNDLKFFNKIFDKILIIYFYRYLHNFVLLHEGSVFIVRKKVVVNLLQMELCICVMLLQNVRPPNQNPVKIVNKVSHQTIPKSVMYAQEKRWVCFGCFSIEINS